MEKAALVVVDFYKNKDDWSLEDSLEELRTLVVSSGASCELEFLCKRDTPAPNYFIGKGKTEELAFLCQENDIDMVVFNDDLSGTQQRNLEEILDVKTIDRTQLILDIFAQRAMSLEGRLQVELAQLEYLLPRLVGMGIILSRLGGGIGTRGPGEQKLEVDRRRIKKRITKLRKEIDEYQRIKQFQAKKRKEEQVASCAIIGYTNAGKSTLLNNLTESNVVVRDQMFSTLDPIARRFTLTNNQKIILMDTVGFIHRLPLHLIEAFKATLEGLKSADLLIHVLDISHPLVYKQNESVLEILDELGVLDRPIINALNKIDKIEDRDLLQELQPDFKNSVCISAKTKENLNLLIDKIMFQFQNMRQIIRVLIPHDKMNLLNMLYEEGNVLKKEFRNDKVYVEAEVSDRLKSIVCEKYKCEIKDSNE
ncbi:MAG: GTPase HflX [Candidatus Omnitrophica bacterium]|nr:GTPase HflX [Candidatus Omnitrophota bacterium]